MELTVRDTATLPDLTDRAVASCPASDVALGGEILPALGGFARRVDGLDRRWW